MRSGRCLRIRRRGVLRAIRLVQPRAEEGSGGSRTGRPWLGGYRRRQGAPLGVPGQRGGLDSVVEQGRQRRGGDLGRDRRGVGASTAGVVGGGHHWHQQRPAAGPVERPWAGCDVRAGTNGQPDVDRVRGGGQD